MLKHIIGQAVTSIFQRLRRYARRGCRVMEGKLNPVEMSFAPLQVG